MSIRVMLDTDNLNDLDGHAELLATYTDLIPDQAALTELRNDFSHSEIILIDRALGDPTGEATVFDMEAHADSVNELPKWIAEKKAAGKKYLTGYCDRNDLPSVIAIAENEIWHWVATLDGACHIAGFIPMRQPAVVQILSASALAIHADLSIVLEDGWHPRGAATEASTPVQKADNLQIPAAVAAAASASMIDLQQKTTHWDIMQEGGLFFARQIGTRTELAAESLDALEAQIRQLYPETIDA